MSPSPRNTPDLVIGPDVTGRWLAVRGDRIVAAGNGTPPAETSTIPVVPCEDGIIVPGAVNSHTHIYSALAPFGMPAPHPTPENFVQILERVWWRLDRGIDADSLRASARLYAAEALLAGTTTLIDHHESPEFIDGSLDVLADSCDEIGIRAVLCFGATERNRGLDEARLGLAECERFLEHNKRSGIRGLVGLHASFTVSDAALEQSAELCSRTGVPMHVHLAEDVADVVDAQARGYQGPLERLLEHKALPAGSITAHGVFLSAEQMQQLDRANCWIVQNPRSNHGNRVGYPQHIARHQHAALGTDGYPADMAEELDFLRQIAEEQSDDVDEVPQRLVRGQALAGQLFGEDEFGTLTPGSPADICVRNAGQVEHTIAQGRWVVRGGELRTADLDEIRAEAREQAPQLWRRMEQF